MLFYYQAASFSVGLLIPIWFLTSSSMCDLVVAPEVQNQGSAFICGFTDSFVFAWSLMLALVHAYIVYIIWSAAEDIRLFPNPELMQYEDSLLRRDPHLTQITTPCKPSRLTRVPPDLDLVRQKTQGQIDYFWLRSTSFGLRFAKVGNARLTSIGFGQFRQVFD